MLVKEFLETYRKQSVQDYYANYKNLRFVVCCGEEAETELCSSENIDWLVKTFGWRAISSWTIVYSSRVIKMTLMDGNDFSRKAASTGRYIRKPDVFTTAIGTGPINQVSFGKQSLSGDSSNDDDSSTTEACEVNEDKELTNEEFLKSLKTQEPSKYDEWDIRSLKIGTRVLNRLAENGIHSVGDLRELSKRDLKDFNGLGYRGIKQLENRLKQLGLGFKKGE